jgi:hypothetical protein
MDGAEQPDHLAAMEARLTAPADRWLPWRIS